MVQTSKLNQFGKIIGMVGTAGLPENVKLALPDLIPDPIELHVDGLGSLLFDGVIGNAASSAVVGLQWCGWLWVGQVHPGQCAWDKWFVHSEIVHPIQPRQCWP